MELTRIAISFRTDTSLKICHSSYGWRHKPSKGSWILLEVELFLIFRKLLVGLQIGEGGGAGCDLGKTLDTVGCYSTKRSEGPVTNKL